MPGAEIKKRRSALLLAAGSLLCLAAPLSLLGLSSAQAGAAVILLHYSLIPALCFFLPFRAARRGINPYLAFLPLPAGLALGWLLLRVNPPAAVFPLNLLLCLTGSAAGGERFKRRPGKAMRGRGRVHD